MLFNLEAMIISKTPLRMSFVGGGSDMHAFYKHNTGAVLSTSINKYIYVTVNKKFDDGIRLAYSRTEEIQSVDEVSHPLVRASLNILSIKGGVEITSIADVPSKGTGLGSSSSFTVGLLNALRAFRGEHSSKSFLAEKSCEIEIDICKEPIGKQDQYAAAYGGLNLIEFHENNLVDITPIICQPKTLKNIEDRILVFYTGITRSASSILKNQAQSLSVDRSKMEILKRMVNLTYHMKRAIESGDEVAFGEILHENWILKKEISSQISMPEIDHWYQLALNSGASGGKILGAGAGGFLMLYAPIDAHEAIRQKLNFLKEMPIKFDRLGSRIIHSE
jgi:D-glycero-alpha-D-manno-heptose-7-phosphate kinase